MRKKLFFVLGLLFALTGSVFAQFSASKTYKISNRNDANVYMQDNGTDIVAVGSFNSNSYWYFESSGKTDCYYVKNATTGKYMQSTKTSGQAVATGTYPVEICVKLCSAEGDGMFGFASTDQTTYDFTSGTIGANWNADGYVQGYDAESGKNHRSFWKVVEEAMPQPSSDPDDLLSMTGTTIGAGADIYLYNIDKNVWLQNNDWNTSYWTTRAEAGTRGFDVGLSISNGGWVMNPKFGKNHSINYSGYFLDTDQATSIWEFTPTTREGYQNVYQIKSGDTQLSVNDNKSLVADGSAKDWQILTRAERITQLAAATSAVDASWLIKSPDFAAMDERFSAWTITTPMSGASYDRVGDASPSYQCNRILKVSKARGASVLQTIEGIPNGYYALSAQGAYSPSEFELGPTNRRNWETGNLPIGAHLYMNSKTIDMPCIYSEGKLASESGFQKSVSGKDGEPTKYFPGGNNQISRDIFDGYYKTGTIVVNVTDGKLTIGVTCDDTELDGQGREWFVVDNFKLTYYGDLGAALAGAIADGEAFTGNTTEALSNALASAIANATTVLNTSTDPTEMIEAAEAIKTALANAEAVDVTLLQQTIVVAETGIDLTAAQDFLKNGTTASEMEQALYTLRSARKLNAQRMSVAGIIGSEPVNGGEFYLLNVGTGLYFSTSADWGTHIALDNPGFIVKFEQEGNSLVNKDLPAFKLSGAGWNGFNWTEEYWDKNGEHKWTFVPVEGKDKVYYMNVYDNYDWHVVYDVANGRCDGNTRYWNALKKVNNTTYYDDPYAQWILLTREQRDALLTGAAEDNPKDATHFIVNPSFTKEHPNGADNVDRGWSGVGTVCKGDRDAFYVIEYFQSDIDLKQTIEGLRPGKYMVSVNGFYRDGTSDNEAAKVGNNEALIQNASLVAYTSDDNKVSALLPNVTSEAGKMPGVGDYRDGVTEAFANWPWQANEYFQTGLYKCATSIVSVGTSGKLTIGVESAYNGIEGSWVVVDNFRLTYLGENPYTSMSILGDFTGGWEFTDDKHMTQDPDNPNIWTMTIDNFYAEGRKYEYKAAANDSWDGYKLPDGLDNADFVFGTTGYPAGYYKLVFTVNTSTHALNLNVTPKTVVTIAENESFVPTDQTDVTIILNRTIATDVWNTFCVPFDISNADLKAQFGDDVAVAEFSETADGLNSTIDFTKMDTPAITANVPVLLKSNTTATSFVFGGDIKAGEAKVPGTNFDFVGTAAASTTIESGSYFLSSNKLYKSAGATTLAGTRAYLKAKTAGARIGNLIFDGDNATTGIANLNVNDNDNQVFDLQGRRVTQPQRSAEGRLYPQGLKKGLYIINGNKVVVK